MTSHDGKWYRENKSKTDQFFAYKRNEIHIQDMDNKYASVCNQDYFTELIPIGKAKSKNTFEVCLPVHFSVPTISAF